MLRTAANIGDIEGYKRLLWFFLVELNVAPPEGVLDFRFPKGRPRSEDTRRLICQEWEKSKNKRKRPMEIYSDIAKKIHGDDYKQADQKERTKLNARVKAQVHRIKAGTKIETI